ncbi:sugar transferase [Candidatus Poriferisodalis multihospitum]|uniref:sugar transferase n=1 Tax=Candidatus Poriferisodalis multihospitum TaxID=2983191 RepID=UPI002B262540|nr:sugar transferase [Candidatus Poriferisodalis multihospitum]
MVVQERHRLPDTTPNIAEQAEPTGEASTSSMVPPGRRGLRFLYVVDAVTLFALMVAITVVRFGLDWPTYPRMHYLIGFGVATFLHMTVYYFGGLYEFEQRLGHRPWLPRAMLLTFMAAGGDATVTLLTGRYLMPRGNLVVLAVAGAVLISFNRWGARRVRLLRFGKPRMLLVGSAADIESASEHLADAEADAVVAGSLTDPALIIGEADRLEVTELLLLSGEPLETVYPEPLGELELRNVGVFRRITPADTLLGLQRSRQIGGMPFVALRTHALPVCRLRFKRLLDLAYLVLLAPFALPLTVAVAIYVRIVGGNGVLYRQERVGRGGAPFVLLKFRTMARDAETNGPVLAASNDPRVMSGMGWLRRTRLDELPQLWNVLTGTMSLVGPRPERPQFVARLEREIAGYGRRHDVPPGITGLAQTQGHYQTDPGYKLGHDLQYVVNWSPVLDWEIMAKSLVVMARRNAR